jgi:hypothetical protein
MESLVESGVDRSERQRTLVDQQRMLFDGMNKRLNKSMRIVDQLRQAIPVGQEGL